MASGLDSWERGRPARLKNCGPAARLRAGRPRSQGRFARTVVQIWRLAPIMDSQPSGGGLGLRPRINAP